MPADGVGGRAEQLASLARLAHEMLVSPETGELLEDAGGEPGSDEAALLRLARREYRRASRLPARLVAVDLARDGTRGAGLGRCPQLPRSIIDRERGSELREPPLCASNPSSGFILARAAEVIQERFVRPAQRAGLVADFGEVRSSQSDSFHDLRRHAPT